MVCFYIGEILELLASPWDKINFRLLPLSPVIFTFNNYIVKNTFSVLGDVMTVYVHSKKLLLEQFGTSDDLTHQPVSTDSNSSQEFTEGLNSYLAPYKLQYLYWHILFAMAVPLVSYSAFTGSIMWYYDISKKHLVN